MNSDEMVAESRSLKCPRCRLLLQREEYEGHAVKFCSTCWGYWLTAEALEGILQDHRYHFSREERKTALQVMATQGDVDREGSEQQAISCPVCAREMVRKAWIDGCPVEIDQCAEHGVWLDTGEIKELQIFAESQ